MTDTKEENALPFEEWISKKIEYMLKQKGSTESLLYNSKRHGYPNEWIYSWINFLTEEVLELYRALEDEHLRNNQLEKELLSVLGLDIDATNKQRAARVKEVREFFVEMRRSLGERNRVDNLEP